MRFSSNRLVIARALVLALPLVALGAGFASEASADDQGATPATMRAYKGLLDRFDANHDGVLQVSELPGPAQERLAGADANHDGAITPAELHAHGVARRAARFARADKNGDGKLEPSEVPPAKWDHIKVADANGDGAVTLDEIERAVAAGTLRAETEGD